MIITLTPRDSARFTVTTLPEECQGPALQHLMTPYVVSWSMYPTLCKGDQLELGPAEPLHVGDLVVFRRPSGLVCHRLIARHDHLLHTQGDASCGPPETVRIEEVLGIVKTVVRASTRIASADLATAALSPSWSRILDHLDMTLRERGRNVAQRLVRLLLKAPRLEKFVSRLIARLATIERITEGPVRSLRGTVMPYPVNQQPGEHAHLHLSSMLRIRLGPISLGIFYPNAEKLDLRPLLTGTGVASALRQSLRQK